MTRPTQRTRSIQFTVPAVPVAQPRPRATVLNGHARVYGAKKSHPVHDFKATCRLAAQEAYSGPVLDGALQVHVMLVMPRPSSKVWKTRPMPREPHTKKPDAENVAKAVLDALTGTCWRDDSQVFWLVVTKEIAAGEEQPHVEVWINEYDRVPARD